MSHWQSLRTSERVGEREMGSVEEVVIVGAGIAGLGTAVALKKVGIRGVVVVERSKELRATGAGLTLFPNAWRALDALGVSHKLLPLYGPSNTSLVTNVHSGVAREVSMASNERSGGGPRTVHRKALLEALAEELPIETIRFSSKLVEVEAEESEGSPTYVLKMEDGAIIKTKVLIGCDGVNSIVARWLGFAKPVSSGRLAVRGLARFPQGHGYKQEIRQFVDPGIRAGFIPLTDKELYWFLVYESSYKGEDLVEADPEQLKRAVLENLAKDFPSAYIDVVNHSDDSTLTFAPLLLIPPWALLLGKLSRGTVTLVGDALHAMTPDLGQGGGSSLEDAVVLGRCLGESYLRPYPKFSGTTIGCVRELQGEVVARAIERYVRERRWRAAKLIALSFLSGWVQQGGGSGGVGQWLRKFLRDVVLYKLLYSRMWSAVNYDCGRLPLDSIPSGSESSRWKND